MLKTLYLRDDVDRQEKEKSTTLKTELINQYDSKTS